MGRSIAVGWVPLGVWIALVAGAAGCAGEGAEADPDAGCRDDAPYQTPVAAAADETFWVGPYQEHTTQHAVAVGWETVEPADTRLEIGPDAGYGRVVTGEPGRMHQVLVDGLEPGTVYHYRACSGERCSGDLTLATAPPPGHPIRVAVYGDCQERPEEHARVVEQIIADGANLVVVVGDTVGDGRQREQYKTLYYDPARRLAHGVPRYAAVGNHDRKDTEVVHFIDYHILPEDPDVPQAETSYSFTFGDAFFLVYDNTLDHYDFFFPLAAGSEPPLWRWLQAQVASPAARAARWRFAFAHYPPHSNCYTADHEYGMPESAVREYVLPLLAAHGFQAHFSGHMHCYERFDFDGLLAITSGGGGGTLEPQERCDDGLAEARVQSCVHHHVLLELGCERARVWARDNQGGLIEQFVLHPDGHIETE